MTKKILFIALPLFALICSNSTFAVEKGDDNPKENKAAVSGKGEIFASIIPFDINTKKLAPNFRGTDIVKLFDLLAKKAPLRKGEFESTIDYEQKIRKAITSDVYAFKLDLTSDKFADSQDRFGVSGYATCDPDLQKLKITINNCNYKDARTHIIVKEVEHPSVKRVRATQYIISFEDLSGLVSNVEINLSSAMANKMKNNIGVLFLCNATLYKAAPKNDFSFSGNDLIFEGQFNIAPTVEESCQ